MKNKEPKVLIISNNCLSRNGSNGKVLAEMFGKFKPENLAQFYIHNENPDFSLCKKYYRVTDKQAVKSLVPFIKAGGEVPYCENEEAAEDNAATKRQGHHNALIFLIRDIIWSLGFWRRGLLKWAEEFKPDLVFFQVGDSAFMPNIAVKTAKKLGVPLMLYCTENYYFKEHNYFTDKRFAFCYPFFRRRLVKAFKKLIGASKCEIYNSEFLAELYEDEFGKKGKVIYQATSLKTFESETGNDIYKFSYAGNLGLGRHISLIEIANVISSLNSEYKLDVYGNATPEVKSALDECENINYHGAVPYSEVISVMEKSDFLFHTESFDKEMIKDSKTAFSTKIADSLVSGRNFVLYADKSLACTKYLLKYDCACVITEKSELEAKLTDFITSPDMQKKYRQKALEVASLNHNASVNGEKFKDIVLELV